MDLRPGAASISSGFLVAYISVRVDAMNLKNRPRDIETARLAVAAG
jgi:hypothetical protein